MEPLNHLIIYRFDDKVTERFMLRLVRRMAYDDALVCAPLWRLEYREPIEGETHYLLCRYGEPVALQYVRSRTWLNELQVKLAFYLTSIGFMPRNTSLKIGGAQTPLSFEHNRLPHMFDFESWHQECEEDEDDKID